jgi:hypothetical protein
MIVDNSIISYLPGGSGVATTAISAIEETVPIQRPRLQIQYN